MKKITDYADEYVGHPQEIDEDLSAYTKREAFKAGMNKAFELINHEIDTYVSNRSKFPMFRLSCFMGEMQGEV